jgi:hypothetical protein
MVGTASPTLLKMGADLQQSLLQVQEEAEATSRETRKEETHQKFVRSPGGRSAIFQYGISVRQSHARQ